MQRAAARILIIAGLLALPAAALGAASPVQEVVALVDAGRFQEAETRLAQALRGPGLTSAQCQALHFERERMRRILLDFSLDEAAVKARVQAQIPDLRDEELAAWDRAGLLEQLVIDGRRRYFNRAPANLFELSAQARARRNPALRPPIRGPMESPHPHHAEVRAEALSSGRSSVAPRRVRITHTLTVHADAVPVGEWVRAWIPYPRELPGQQEALRLVETVPARRQVAPRSAKQRTVFLRQRARAGQPTRFAITYELTVFGQHHVIAPETVVPAPLTAETRPHLEARAPHLAITEELRAFSRQVVGTETNPYRIAQRLYAAVDRFPWAGAREYSTLSNISAHALRAGYGDCGQQTMLLMALLRLNGIPARWQSGIVFSDGDYFNLHDWAWMYLAPYGWVPIDVTTGRFTTGDPELAGFYFGGLDAYRIAFNDDFGRPFVPAKRHVRSETVDSQRGEVEWRGGNLYFDQWDYDLTWDVLPRAGKR